MSSVTRARSIVFDLDGTLVDSLPGIEFSVDCALAACGLPLRRRELRPLIGPPIRNILEQLVADSDEQQLHRLEQAFRSSYDATGWQKTLAASSAIELLRSLHEAGLQLFIATNKPAAPTHRILAHLGIAELFSEILCRDSRIRAFSSKAEMLRHLIEAHQLQPQTCLYVGDTAEDYRAAREVGLPVAIVSYGYGEGNAAYPGCIHLDELSGLLTVVETTEMS